MWEQCVVEAWLIWIEWSLSKIIILCNLARCWTWLIIFSFKFNWIISDSYPTTYPRHLHLFLHFLPTSLLWELLLIWGCSFRLMAWWAFENILIYLLGSYLSWILIKRWESPNLPASHLSGAVSKATFRVSCLFII